ncbi:MULTISPECIES: hypothetical protein [unclassified Caballeronia]|uniref:hypothetical protein n=1 Tax=unclassified Caballeronia TaxID=2646786 RepID=UPI002865320F|nr:MULTISPECIES: hypothetical protein [unclassified Caballeronia]MDR5776259.1 hypothetical protein [Caballeronia sp. LZ002]MDR5851699.1 hypothetical protein [Caballeronia sp. LZ003]
MNPDFIPMAFPESVAAYDLLDREVDEAVFEEQPVPICIGCGAKQNADGSLPCGHDHDL